MTWVEVLRKNLNYHGKNETVKRYPYWLAAKEILKDFEIPDDMLSGLSPEFAAKAKALN